jgi:hypothetical protein
MGAVLLSPIPAAAQDHNRVLVALANNTPAVTGEFEDLYQGTVFIRVTLHDQRRIPLAQIKFMNFEGKDEIFFAEKTEAAGPNQLLVLKSGLKVKGQLVNIEGGAGSQKENDPRMVSFRDLDGRVGQFRMGDCLRMYLIDW